MKKTIKKYQVEVDNIDSFVTIVLKKQFELYEYVDVSVQDNIEVLDRQLFNPFFIELGFFDTITQNKINNSSELSSDHITYIRNVRPDINVLYPNDQDLLVWFDNYGIKQLPWNSNTPNPVTIDTLSEVTVNYQDIISKANFFQIIVNS